MRTGHSNSLILKNKSMDNSKLLVGFLAGAAVGGLLGVLLAPDKGTETRRKIMDKSSEFTGTVKDKFNEVVDGVKETLASKKDQMKNGVI
jgi:gas vesicle protein